MTNGTDMPERLEAVGAAFLQELRAMHRQTEARFMRELDCIRTELCPPQPEDDALTAEEAGRVAGISYTGMLALLSAGVVPARTVGRKGRGWRVSRATAEAVKGQLDALARELRDVPTGKERP
jgi:hypothetical protein